MKEVMGMNPILFSFEDNFPDDGSGKTQSEKYIRRIFINHFFNENHLLEYGAYISNPPYEVYSHSVFSHSWT